MEVCKYMATVFPVLTVKKAIEVRRKKNLKETKFNLTFWYASQNFDYNIWTYYFNVF